MVGPGLSAHAFLTAGCSVGFPLTGLPPRRRSRGHGEEQAVTFTPRMDTVIIVGAAVALGAGLVLFIRGTGDTMSAVGGG